MTIENNDVEQLGFEGLLADAEKDNKQRSFENKTAHLPGEVGDAIEYYRALLAEHHATMMAADVDETMRLRDDAHLLAIKLNGGEPGILAEDDAPGCMLARVTAAPDGSIPLWGQQAVFVISLHGMQALVEMDGIFGIGGSHCYWPGFSASVVDTHKPFLSETGYRSFLGIYAEPVSGLSPDEFARAICTRYIEDKLNGKLVAVAKRYTGEAA